MVNSGLCWVETPFVAEVAVDLVDALQAADHQALQVKFRRDAQEQIDVERVVMGDERPRGGASGDRLHHRSFDLDEVARIEEAADRLHDAGALGEDLAHLGIDADRRSACGSAARRR